MFIRESGYKIKICYMPAMFYRQFIKKKSLQYYNIVPKTDSDTFTVAIICL